MSLLAPPPAAVAPPGTSPSTFSDDMAPPQLSFTSTSLPSSDLSTEVVGLMNSPTGTPGVSSMVSKQPAASTASVSPLSASNLIGALQSPNTFVKGLMENEQDDDIDYSKSLIEELDIHPPEIIRKLRCIMLPWKVDVDTFSIATQQSDFWGPFVVVLIYSILLVWGQFKVVGWVMLLWLVGSYAILFLARSLGASVQLNFSQVLQVLGYSCFCLSVTVVLVAVASVVTGGSPTAPHTTAGQVLGWVVRVAGTAWASSGAARVLGATLEGARRAMLAYPIALLFLFLLMLY